MSYGVMARKKLRSGLPPLPLAYLRALELFGELNDWQIVTGYPFRWRVADESVAHMSERERRRKRWREAKRRQRAAARMRRYLGT
jgi:hypothetical protein